MIEKKFDPKKLHKLNNPERLESQPPDLIWKTLALDNPNVLVDIGAGTGFFAMPFSEKMEAGTVYACDTSDVMIEWMQKNIPEKYAGMIKPLKCEESSIPLESAIADLVYMINLHHELDEPQSMLKEAARLLRTGGLLAVIDWKPVEMESGPPLKIRIPESVIADQFRQAGLTQVCHHDILPYHSFTVGRK